MDLVEFKACKSSFNHQLKEFVFKTVSDVKMRNRVMYCLNGGKRLRPIICLDVCRSLAPSNTEAATSIGLALEFVHNASLIIDDMPCMDNDAVRRGRESFHVKYSLSDAQVTASYLLHISLKLLVQNCQQCSTTFNQFVHIFTKNIGILGLAGGQWMDLTPSNMFQSKREFATQQSAMLNPGDASPKQHLIRELFLKKTCSLFEMAFASGFLCGGGDVSRLGEVSKAACVFGIAFQIYDDFDDVDQDKARDEKNLLDPNYINNFGVEAAYNEFFLCLQQFKSIMENLSLMSTLLTELCSFLSAHVESKYALIKEKEQI